MAKILVISDKNDDLIKISTLVSDLIPDCLVITAQSGLQGIEKAKTESPSTILLDIEMPEIDGYEVCKRLKSGEKTKHIPIIMLMEIKSDPKSRVKGLESGADTLLKKPIDEVELITQINMALRISKAEKEKAEIKYKLQQARKMEAIGTLTGGIVHEFNNILFPIIGYAEMSKYDVSENSKVRNNLEKILKAADRAKNLIQQILAFSQQDDQERKPLKVQYIIKATLKLLRASFPATIEIRQNIDNACGSVMADPSEIQQVIMNLANNAYHSMKEKSGVLEVTLSEVDIDSGDLSSKIDLDPGSYLQLTVSDTGCGAEHEDMEHISDSHFTIHGQGEEAGMGLIETYGIIQNCQGNISVHSDPDKGTTVRVYLPLIDTKSDEIQEITAEQDIPTGNESVLLVDDEEDVVEMMHSMLERLGYQVFSINSSIGALDTFRQKPEKFDLVITDQTMPEMTGMELAKELILIRSDIPIILCTGYSEVITEDNAKSLGVKEYVMKPVRVTEVAMKIRKVLDRNRRKT